MKVLKELAEFPTDKMPEFGPDWRLVIIDGLVAEPLALSLDDLLKLPKRAVESDFEVERLV